MLDSLLISMPFMTCLFWTAVLVLEWRRQPPPKHVLAVFMAMGTVLYLCHMVYFAPDMHNSWVFNSIYAFCNIGVFPMYYLYIRRLTHGSGTLHRLPVLLPALVIGVWTCVQYKLFPDNEVAARVRDIVVKTVFLLQLFPVCIFSYLDLNEFDRKVYNMCADTEFRSMRRARNILIVLMVGAFISAIANFVGRDYFGANPSMLAWPSLLFSSLLFCVGYVGDKYDFCIDNISVESSRLADSTSSDGVPVNGPAYEQTIERLLGRLDHLMNDEKLYLRHDIRLADVVQQMGVSRTVVSNLINQNLGLSFSDYINGLRVKHAQKIISELKPQENTLFLDILEQSGFSSETSFYRSFRKHTGMTPKEWARISRN